MDARAVLLTGRVDRGHDPESASVASESIDESAASFRGLGKGFGRALPVLLARFFQ